MNILVACEESQIVTINLRRLGHIAFSCDIEPCSGGYPEWHVQQDVLSLLNGHCSFQTVSGVLHTCVLHDRWDMIFAFPPCTKTSNAGASHLWRGGKLNIPRYYDGLCGKALFESILHANCLRIAIENPVPSLIFEYPQFTQAVQPYLFGDAWSKKTLLWLRGLNPLEPTNIVTPLSNCHDAGTWFSTGGKDRQKNRSKTPQGLAFAMAEQWAGKCVDTL